MEEYISDLSEFIRYIQQKETSLYKNFKENDLKLIKNNEKASKDEIYFRKFRKELSEIQKKRKVYRELLSDAKAQKQRLLDSLILDKEHNSTIKSSVIFFFFL